jgi:hypothetical protein
LETRLTAEDTAINYSFPAGRSMAAEASGAGCKLPRRTVLRGRYDENEDYDDCHRYVITAAFLLAVVAGTFAAVILGGYGIAQLILSALGSA